ncbi:TIGR03557 family F420-dependent LLM class oxidoreductase [Gryllotalpicola ginsengisoli]|uniref:TIGR03557 family F420-dependent LLM class oxidoreductase n=1 Tax=Gryllotalpicola ginsengisoli TaxID=444608 RepID=UPI0003B547FA|nr:TIGR03557 family F420-dependent LLM class oxidoreductase [Gryllotalpicola ginsengisoli]
MRYGYKLMAEGFGPAELVRQAVRAEEAGFDFVEISDHYHPWLESQGHSPFAWTVLGAIAAKTERLGLATGVTCPSMRYHPAIIAQAAATLQLVSDGRFTLGLGAGESLNEHIVGPVPSARVRHERLREAIEIIRLLWRGGYHSYDGRHLQLHDARVFDLPERLPEIAVAVSGEASVRLAAELADGLFAVEPRRELVAGFRERGGNGPLFAEVPLAWGPSEEEAVEAAFTNAKWALSGWKVMSELPNPVNFEAASGTVRPEDVAQQFACGPDPQKHLQAIATYAEAGFDHLVLQNAGDDPDGFIDFFARELKPQLAAVPAGA